MVKKYVIDKDADIPFHNGMDYCVGTGRMGLALQKEYQEQLALVQEEIGFSHIRGHGLFSDDMGIYREYEDENGVKRAEYCFTYLDLVMDSYLKLHIRPFLELGFMPGKLASGDQTVFYWKGNVTPPRDYEGWRALVQATLRHLMERYGAKEVTGWPVEVWNEPNLPGFWKDADMEEYFRLFRVTFRAVKEVDSRFRVGGPAVCGVEDEKWIRLFLEFCEREQLSVDFITRHHYTTEAPEQQGHYGYARLRDPEEGFANLQTTRDIVDSFEAYRGKEIHITEFNTSYIPNCPLHDTNRNAAYIAHQLSRLGDVNTSFSYWTFGDIFEEFGVPFTPFHGGFGLVADGGIPKPTFWTFQFFKDLKGTCVHRSEEAVIVRKAEGGYRGVVWNRTLDGTGGDLSLEFVLPEADTMPSGEKVREYCLVTRTVDEDTCNPLKLWHDLGEPSHLSGAQKKLLKEGAVPLVETKRQDCVSGAADVRLTVKKNGVISFEVLPVRGESDRGYSYARAIGE